MNLPALKITDILKIECYFTMIELDILTLLYNS
jgi:hypothetical protein